MQTQQISEAGQRGSAAPLARRPSPAAKARVALVNMPFGMADRPSIQCGLLKAALTRRGHEVDVFYLNLEFAAEFGGTLYRKLSAVRTDVLAGDWLFSVAAFGYRPDEEAYRRSCPSIEELCRETELDFDKLCEFRNEILPAWIGRWARAVEWDRYPVIGFTSTFEQNNAGFGLAHAIKESTPAVSIVFGGANFDGDMGREYVRALPFIDYAVIGEGDRAFPALVEQLVAGDSPLGVPGVVGRMDGLALGHTPPDRVHDMDDLPDPDYDDYFGTLFRLGPDRILSRHEAPLLLIETARGCWWGQRHHCTFCGLNANGMQFRAKSPDAALAQVHRLADRYKINNFSAVDNIMDYKYLEQVCGPLGEEHFDYRFFYEVKANLKRAQLRGMARAGVRHIQPGIESLSSHVLKLMNKGISMLHNVRCMKWAHYYGMRVSWNILTGFPGETDEDYDEQLRVIPLLRHLQPPAGWGRIWLERFSPYFTDRPPQVENVRPLDAYRFIYPEERLNLEEIAYFFAYEMRDTLPDSRHDEMGRLIAAWKAAWKARPRPELVYQRTPGWIQVVDRRNPEPAAHAFNGLPAAVYECCSETDHSVAQLCEALGEDGGGNAARDEVEAALGRFVELGLMLHENGRYLSLALPRNAHW
jgi:ribosomal peptide maturation radical SAM protein 1